ncbi:maleylpyruvate isomerase family mycothiol-dependent enzyme [Micromonospora sp. DR5-3]|uniref:maleylpyruvate isomerase family mycothiol-dependent enzyme n=1 Tax=unclassified Micromonospora TaxID=2617518 RepID=UPI0011D653F3|nr:MULTISPECIES: maleylpyruvate isomerase family mycothiol-dependent enzyme [unclassified Micromonospora]MCW3817031.1 maleylpyruvate isomerase family mycothiol-dependent enzyme [Micromonospora sp. DR5-3]TYC21739.1 maleylpyruvate isomerase family mycothiol-dependent enzyme [Micromonospora sp. MP36]
MSNDPLLLTGEVDDATARLLRTVAAFDAADVAAASLLPRWTLGHVLTHLARNADGFVNLLTAARTGEAVPMYASPAARAADIEAGAARSPDDLFDDLRRSADRFAEAVAATPAEAWTATVQTPRGPRVAALLVWDRLREVEVHHVDLAAGYRPADWPEAFSHRLLHEVAADLGDRAAAPAMVLRFSGSGCHELGIGDRAGAPTVAGAAPDLAAWLIGRAAGEVLTVTPDGPLPNPPEWI